jgi:lipid-binding SYLF domain-containing protein
MYTRMRLAAITPFLVLIMSIAAYDTSLAYSGDQTSATDANAKLKSDGLAALDKLYATEPKARDIGRMAKGILVFPEIQKAGLIVGGQGGKGVLIQNGAVTGIYSNAAASFGLQAGVQSFSEVMFFTTDAGLKYLDTSDGWSIGTGPSFVVVDQGMANSMTTDSLRKDVYIFIYGQKGLMGGLGVQGQKISQVKD